MTLDQFAFSSAGENKDIEPSSIALSFLQDIGRFHKDNPAKALTVDAGLCLGALLTLTPGGRRVGAMLTEKAVNAGAELMESGVRLAEEDFFHQQALAMDAAGGRFGSAAGLRAEPAERAATGAMHDIWRTDVAGGGDGPLGPVLNLGGMYGPLHGSPIIREAAAAADPAGTALGHLAAESTETKVFDATPAGNLMRELSHAENTASPAEIDQIAFLIGKFPADHRIHSVINDLPRIQELLPEMTAAPSEQHAMLLIADRMDDENIVGSVAERIIKYVRQ